MADLFAYHRFSYVVHLAAQAGVRYSLVDPDAYVDTNLVGFGNIIEGCRRTDCQHLLYASSSSVYGANTRMPFRTSDNVDHPLNMYAATKKANELMAHAYAHLFAMPVTGLRFFTVYGPWGRPDMAMWLFAAAIRDSKPIQLFNGGRMRRDFTYIDDVVEAVVRLVKLLPQPNAGWSSLAPDPASSNAPWRVYNIGNGQPVEVLDIVGLIEKEMGGHSDHFDDCSAPHGVATEAEPSYVSNAIAPHPSPNAEFARCYLRLAILPNRTLDRLSRYEAILWRQVRQILIALDALDRRKPQDRGGRFLVGSRQDLPAVLDSSERERHFVLFSEKISERIEFFGFVLPKLEVAGDNITHTWPGTRAHQARPGRPRAPKD